MDISRITARDRSYEFTHKLRYTIEVVGTMELPPAVRQLASASRRGLLGIGDLIGTDALERFWYSHRAVRMAAPRTAEGSVRLLVPEHVTEPAEPGSAVPGRRPIIAQDVRWDDPGPSRVSADLAPLIGQVDFAAAPLIAEWAPHVTIPLSRRPADPRAAASVPGFELSTGRGIRLAASASSPNTRAKIKQLLVHAFTIPLAKGNVRVGINLERAVKLTEAELKGRDYVQRKSSAEHEEEQAAGGDLEATALGGRETSAGVEEAEAAPLERQGESTEAHAAESTNILERNSESVRLYDYYSFDFTLVFHGPQGSHLAMRVERGLITRLARATSRRCGARSISPISSLRPLASRTLSSRPKTSSVR